MFGQVGFNYGAHVRGQSYTPGRWPILSIMILEIEITVRPEDITIQGHDEERLNEVSDFLKSTSTASVQIRDPQPVNTQCNEIEYMTLVAKALVEIRAGQYSKIVASRFVDLGRLVDMPATLLHGCRANTPARGYTLKHGGFQATGFSPELVIAVEKCMVVTE
jgi:salicylate synthetase